MNNGYIKLHRKILDNPIVMKDAEYFAVWIYLLLNATHKDMPAVFKGEKIILKPGQLIVGCKSIGNELGINYVKIHRILSCYESEKQIEKQSSNKNTLITVKNWELYQNNEKQNEIEMKNNCKTNENKQEYKEVKNIYTTTTTTIDKSIFEVLEESFGRTLSQAEYEVVANWNDNALTRYAIKQAELARVSNVRYIDKILYEYKKNNIKTVAEAEERDKKFKDKKLKNSYQSKRDKTREFLNKEMERIKSKSE